MDTNIFIYLYENHPDYADIAEFIVCEAERGVFSGIVTPITFSEIVVKPYAMRRPDIADRCVGALRGYRNIRCKSIDGEIAKMAGALRAKYKRPLPDMYQAAIALQSPTPILITNDKSLAAVKEIRVLTIKDFKTRDRG